MKKYIVDYATLLTFAGGLVALDQWTKYLVRVNLTLGEMWSPWEWLSPYARIVHWGNTGAAFGMLQSLGLVFTVLAILVSLAILYYFPQIPRQDWFVRLALGMQLAGAVGNLLDRLTRGYVTDFISVGTFPVFNVADSCISVGVAILIIGVWIRDLKTKRKNGAVTPSSSTPPDRFLEE